MVFEHIEKLKREYTDKFVVVDDKVCELRRFQGLTGTVRTVNMSGRALVEFAGNNNIGWFDIDIDFLSVVDPPTPAAESPKKEAPKSAKAPSKLEKARGTAESGSRSDAANMSIADVLAAARKHPGEAVKTPAKAAPKSGAMSVEDMLAAARGEKGGGSSGGTSPPAASSAGGGSEGKSGIQQQLEAARKQEQSATAAPAKAAPAASQAMSVEEMLAAARAEKSGSAPAAPPETAPPETAPAASPPAADPPPATEAAPPAEPAASSDGGRRDDITDVEGQLAYCRQTDGG